MVLLLSPKYMSSKFSGFLVALKNEMPYFRAFPAFFIIQALCGLDIYWFFSVWKAQYIDMRTIYSLYSVAFSELLGTFREHSLTMIETAKTHESWMVLLNSINFAHLFMCNKVSIQLSRCEKYVSWPYKPISSFILSFEYNSFNSLFRSTNNK